MTEQKNQQQSPQQGNNDNNKGQSGKNTPDTGKGNDPYKMTKKQEAPDPDDEPMTQADFKPDKSTQIGDDPEQTKKKIPNMNK
jgi:hypothetical protein